MFPEARHFCKVYLLVPSTQAWFTKALEAGYADAQAMLDALAAE